MSQTLYRKWRPQKWDQVIGQEHIVQTLRNAVTSDHITHAYLFAGPRGTGKTTTARLLAKTVNCLVDDLSARPCDQCIHCQAINQGRFLDLIEIDAASNTSVEDVRDLREKINFSPNQGRFKVYIVDEVHMLSTAAFNALLKTLEEPPPHAIFILATTEVHKIPATVLSRCQRHEFRRIPVAELVAQLERITTEEGFEAEGEALSLIARQSTGSMRDAISLLDQMASTGQAISLELTEKILGTVTSQAVLDVIEAMIAGDPAAGLDHIHRTLDAGCDPRLFARQIVDHLRNLLLARMGSGGQVDATAEVCLQIAHQSQQFTVDDLLRRIQFFNRAANEARNTWQPSLPLEMAFVESVENIAIDRPGNNPGHNPASAKPTSVKDMPGTSTPATSNPEGGEAPDSLSVDAVYSSDLSYQNISANWQQVVSLVAKTSPQVHNLLRSCKPYGVKAGVLFLGFDNQILKSKMERKECLQIVEEALAKATGKDIPVRCFVAGQRQTLPEGVESDGMVAAALRDLGGEIVDIQ